MHRFFISKPTHKTGSLILRGKEWHHCQNVLRAKVGDQVSIFDGEGTEFLCNIRKIDSESAELHVLQQSKSPPPPYHMVLAQALPKNKAMDLIIQKATELGVREIIPIMSERSTIKLDPADTSAKVERWDEISVESAKQCGLNWLPKIHSPKSMKEVMEMRQLFNVAFIASLQPEAKSLWAYLHDPKIANSRFLVLIGPEGDFTPAESSLARAHGFLLVTLGPLVLRCDTAATYMLSTLSYELRRLREIPHP
jgi:16S rRNA (uracil1498-N3)-methyltransferase